jgi:hypothetical protein
MFTPHRLRRAAKNMECRGTACRTLGADVAIRKRVGQALPLRWDCKEKE